MEWRDIPGFEGRYQAHPDGSVRSVSRVVRAGRGERLVEGKVLVSAQDGRGYYVVNLSSDDGRRKTITWPVHKIVALTFLGPRPFEGAQIRHLSGDKSNNAASNLAYGTRSENERDKIRHKRSNRGARCGSAKLTDRQVCAIEVLLADTDMPQVEIAALFGVSPSRITAIKNGRHHFGEAA